MKSLVESAVIAFCLLLAATAAHASGPSETAAGSAAVVQFRQGDRMPVNFTFAGDFLESDQGPPQYITVKRDFWVQTLADGRIQLSLDGQNFKDIEDIAKGSIGANATTASGSSIANGIDLSIQSYVR